jgi:hypothetical protein
MVGVLSTFRAEDRGVRVAEVFLARVTLGAEAAAGPVDFGVAFFAGRGLGAGVAVVRAFGADGAERTVVFDGALGVVAFFAVAFADGFVADADLVAFVVAFLAAFFAVVLAGAAFVAERLAVVVVDGRAERGRAGVFFAAVGFVAACFFFAAGMTMTPPGECERRTLASISLFRERYPGRSPP